ncbi:MAG TPA: beta-ketoacyl synthase N-terminal-like domain-containing protein, partial [Thermoanaerobaculia bacterium]|nr:beta-ketoacyl synthase N-terminal-like domain-containing protein [Thermoanaerobaculia bacterium]
MSSPRVAITGLGIISPFGRGRAMACAAMRDGRSGIRRITSIDTAALNCRIGGEVPAQAHQGAFKGFDRFSRFALIAAEEAMAQAKIENVDPERFGVIVGTGLGGCETLDAAFRRVYKEGQPRVPPTSIPWSMYNAAASALAAKYGARGIAYAVVSACAS